MTNTASDWATTTGDIWAERWRDLDRALAALSPQLIDAVVQAAPTGPFRAFDVGCGAGTTTLAVAEECPDASIIACDLSPSLVRIANERAETLGSSVRVVLGDAEALALSEGPFDIIFSRHGIMFFPDPVRAFGSLRRAAVRGGSLVFSCFRQWADNPWASELASAAAGRTLPPPGREPSGFAFADPDYVREIFGSSGWTEAEPRAASFEYVAGEGAEAVEQALSLLSAVGPASAVMRGLSPEERGGAIRRLREAIECHVDGDVVRFAAAAWIWSAKAGPA